MQTRLHGVCQMVERNNGLFRALFTCQQKLPGGRTQEETVLVNLRKERGLPKRGRTYSVSFHSSAAKENGK